MLKIKPQNPKGVRDYLPLENQRREYIISVIKKHYELYGFSSIYNPVFERLETLQGKYGEEGDKLLFKILNSGEYIEENRYQIETSFFAKLKMKECVCEWIVLVFDKVFKNKDLTKEFNDNLVITNQFKNNINEIGEICLSKFFKQISEYNERKYLFVKNDDKTYNLANELIYDLFVKNFIHFNSFNNVEIDSSITSHSQIIDLKVFNFLSKVMKEENRMLNSRDFTIKISSKGLRYDHTVPLARFVSQHQNELTFPFKRYVIGPVWRADRPQRGRYQEFFQCDADIVGSKGLVSDVEMITLIDSVFKELNLKVEIRINNRKIYNGICDSIDIEKSQVTPVSTILDKWDKIGEDKVKEELSKLIGEEKTTKLIDILSIQNFSEISTIENAELKEGISELEYIFKYSKSQNLKFDLRLLRGLDYYTGTILEMISTEMEYGSIGGGGRYDDLTELFGLKDMSGIGISFGLDRVYDVMTELKRFPENSEAKKTLILNLTEAATSQYFSLLSEIRGASKIVDLYPSIAKMDKQLAYADKAGYSYAIIIGEKELEDNQITIKDLKQRQQTVSNREQMLSFL